MNKRIAKKRRKRVTLRYAAQMDYMLRRREWYARYLQRVYLEIVHDGFKRMAMAVQR